MATVIYPSPIFGPVHSRRLGVSLGINLLPSDGKFCTFDCIYCECGFNADFRPHQKLPTREEVRNALEARLQDMQQHGPRPDVLTFAGNGGPTAHPQFSEIINSFYEYTLSIKEQLSLAKRLQQNQYFNIQGMLDSNCNAILMDNLNKSMINLKDLTENIPTSNNNDEMTKSLISNNITSEEDINYSKIYQRCNATKDIFKKIINCDPYILYIPKQIAVTLTKQLTKVNSLDVIGCEGYKKLKKIAKIK